MKNVLLPTDFSKNAENAISYALNLYKKENCSFTLLHAYKVDDYHEKSRLIPIPAEEKLAQAQREAEEKLETLIEKFRQTTSSKHKFHLIAANIPLVTAVKEEISKWKTDVVILGTKGHTGSSEVVYGSNTVNLMEEIQRCPLLAIPANVNFISLQEIVLANSFKTELTQKDLDFLIHLSQKFQAPIRILRIAEEGGMNELQKQNKRLLKEKLQNVVHSFHTLEYLSIPLGIYSFTESRGSEMIAFINKKHSFFENLLFDPFYKNLAHYSRVPVLVLHQP